MTYKDHVLSLTGSLPVTWISVPEASEASFILNRRTAEAVCVGLVIPEPDTLCKYAICLHELGHVMTPAISEAKAWQWAREHALEWSPMLDDLAYWAAIETRKGMQAFDNRPPVDFQWSSVPEIAHYKASMDRALRTDPTITSLRNALVMGVPMTKLAQVYSNYRFLVLPDLDEVL